mmetsp:Transcript_18188/g.28547  ORF Transcript_18188/g.28547 Transcript_18188/m.28547 type:complete len:236 (-) Transcript_18188:422-1129(-)
MVDNPGGHKQRRLESQMVDDVEHRRDHRRLGPKTQQHGQQAKMAHRRKRQQAFEIIFKQRDHRAQHHSDQTRGRHDIEPRVRTSENRPHPCHQKHTGFHHRGRMQVRGHWGWRGHRMWQPEVERELGGLCERPNQDQDQRGHIPLARLDHIPLRQNVGQVIAANDIPKDQHAADHRQATRAGHGQRHTRALATFRQVLPIADQQEGRETGQLPEDQQKQDVVGQNNAQHRALEEQ